jgi:predicted nucleic acid-binding protein
MDSLVFDTSAILNFGHRGELTALLKKLSGEYRLFTTHGAQAELTDPARAKFYEAFVREHFTVKTASTSVFDLATLSRLVSTLDSGELSVLALARELNGFAVLDDRAARNEAKTLDLRLYGTLGLLHLALQKKWLSEAECLARVGKLCDSKFAIPRPDAGQSFANYLRKLA